MNNESRFRQRFQNFEKAYKKLSAIMQLKNRSEWSEWEDMALIQAIEA